MEGCHPTRTWWYCQERHVGHTGFRLSNVEGPAFETIKDPVALVKFVVEKGPWC